MEKPNLQEPALTYLPRTSEWAFVFHHKYPLARHQKLFVSGDRFTHVTLLTQSGPWLTQIHPTFTGVQIDTLFDEGCKEQHVDLLDYCELWVDTDDNVDIVYHAFDARKPTLWQWPSYMLPTCVTLAKGITGFNSSAVTPYGLYAELIDRGGYLI